MSERGATGTISTIGADSPPREEPDLLAYVKAAAAALALPLDDAQARRVAVHLERTAALARQLEQARIGASDDPAQVYCPSPFPALP